MKSWLCALPLLVLPVLGSAQTTAPQPDPPKPVAPLPPRVEGTIDFSFVSTTGNTDTQSIGLSGDTRFRPGAWEIRNRAAFVRSHTGDELSAQSLVYLLRAGRKFSTRLSGFGQYDYTRDTFAGIEHRNALLGGIEYLLLETGAHSLKTFAGFGYVNELRLTGRDVRSGAFDTGWGYKLKVSTSAEIADDLRWAISFYDSSDWRFNHVAALTTRINSFLSLKVSHSTRYVNFPPPGFDPTDTVASVALVTKF